MKKLHSGANFHLRTYGRLRESKKHIGTSNALPSNNAMVRSLLRCRGDGAATVSREKVGKTRSARYSSDFLHRAQTAIAGAKNDEK